MISDIKRIELRKVKIDRDGQQPLYSQINDKLCRLLDENFSAGDLFYSEQELTRALQVSRITVRRVIDDLDRAGRLVRQPGRKALVAGGDSPTRRERREVSVRSRARTPSDKVQALVLLGLTWQSESVMGVVDQLTAVSKTHGVELKLRIVHADDLESFASSINSQPDEEAFLIFAGSRTGNALFNILSKRGYRTVALDNMTQDYAGNAVYTNAEYAIDLALEHLIGLGHSNIVLLVNEKMRDESVIVKVEEFKKVMREHGLSGRIAVTDQLHIDSYASAYEIMPEVWADGLLRPTAIMTVSDPGAWAALKWLREQGVSIPEDVSVVGFENASSSSHVLPPLTTIAHPIAEIVDRAVNILLDPTQNLADRVIEAVKPTLVLRESTGPAPNDA